MNITAARVHHVRHDLVTPAGPAGAYNAQRQTLLLRLTAADGTVGWGETYALPGIREALESFAPRLVGRSAFDTVTAADLPGADGFVLGAIDIAQHDLQGRLTGTPVAELLGGRRRDRIPAYASGFLYIKDRPPADNWPDEAKRAADRGFASVKLRVGGADAQVELDAIDRLQAQLGPSVSVSVDAWGAYDLAAALAMGRGLAEREVIWFEEPVRPDAAWTGYYELRETLSVPIAGGEMGGSLADFRALFHAGAVDVVQPDIAICGGLRVACVVAELARQHGVDVVPHTWNGPVMAAATAHLIATLPPLADGTSPLLEVDTSENRLIGELVHTPLFPVDGQVPVPDGPGLGVDVDEEFLARFEVRA